MRTPGSPGREGREMLSGRAPRASTCMRRQDQGCKALPRLTWRCGWRRACWRRRRPLPLARRAVLGSPRVGLGSPGDDVDVLLPLAWALAALAHAHIATAWPPLSREAAEGVLTAENAPGLALALPSSEARDLALDEVLPACLAALAAGALNPKTPGYHAAAAALAACFARAELARGPAAAAGSGRGRAGRPWLLQRRACRHDTYPHVVY